MSDRPARALNPAARASIGAIVLLILSFPFWVCPPAASADLTLEAAVHNPQRSAKFVARDGARHPLEELAFFGVTPQSTVVEIWSGGGYWTEILAPFLRDHGVYYAALGGKGASDAANAEAEKLNAAFRAKIAADAATYGKIIPTVLGVGQTDIAPAGSADVVLTFRNLHNWLEQGYAPEVFAAFYRALKPGGVLGIEDHRGQRDAPQDPKAADGYVRQITPSRYVLKFRKPGP